MMIGQRTTGVRIINPRAGHRPVYVGAKPCEQDVYYRPGKFSRVIACLFVRLCLFVYFLPCKCVYVEQTVRMRSLQMGRWKSAIDCVNMIVFTYVWLYGRLSRSNSHNLSQERPTKSSSSSHYNVMYCVFIRSPSRKVDQLRVCVSMCVCRT